MLQTLLNTTYFGDFPRRATYIAQAICHWLVALRAMAQEGTSTNVVPKKSLARGSGNAEIRGRRTTKLVENSQGVLRNHAPMGNDWIQREDQLRDQMDANCAYVFSQRPWTTM